MIGGMPRPATLADVAAAAGVSMMTVSRVVNGSARVSDGTRERVQAVMVELGYIPNQLARSLVVRRLGLIALVVADITHPWFTELAHAVELAAAGSSYTTIFGNTDGEPAAELAYLEKLSALRVDGVILAPAASSAPGIDLLIQRGIPFVTIDRRLAELACDHVQGESVKSARELVDHLIGHGRKRIAVISGPAEVSTATDRVAGWRLAMRKAGLPAPRVLVRHTAFTREAAREVALELLARPDRPDGVFAANAFMAFGVLDAAAELGLQVPEDLGLVTFDAIERDAVEPFLTCAQQPARLIGRTALDLLLARLEGDAGEPRTVVLDGEIRLHRSCGCEPSLGRRPARPVARQPRSGRSYSAK